MILLKPQVWASSPEEAADMANDKCQVWVDPKTVTIAPGAQPNDENKCYAFRFFELGAGVEPVHCKHAQPPWKDTVLDRKPSQHQAKGIAF